MQLLKCQLIFFINIFYINIHRNMPYCMLTVYFVSQLTNGAETLTNFSKLALITKKGNQKKHIVW